VPEALAAIVTGALAIGMHQMAKRNALIRKMPAVETLGCTTVICSDKTGTLTKGEMTVRQVVADGQMLQVTGVGYDPQGEIRAPALTNPRGNDSLRQLLLGGLLCNDALLEQAEGKWLVKGDPTEGGLVVLAVKGGLDQQALREKYPRVGEIPFSSERKRMSTLHRDGQGRFLLFMKGAPEEVLGRTKAWLINGEVQRLSAEDRANILLQNEAMAQSALRVLGLAYKELPECPPELEEEAVENEMVFLGLVGMIDPPRDEAVAAVKICRQIKIKTVMITGDHELTAVAIAREIGIYRKGDLVLTGRRLEKMTQEELEKLVDRVSVYARVSPLHKLNIVKAWKARGEVVAMTGDGVNDAPALKQADIGIAMGITGTEVTKDAADMVLSDDNFATIVNAVERGRWIYDNIKKYLTYLLRCNITEVAVIGGIVLILGPEYLPLLPAAILYINLATDGLPALALGIAPPDPDIMQRPPRDPREGVFTWDVKAFILMALILETPFFYFLFFHERTSLTHARTEIFFLFVIIELIIALNFRSLRFSIFKAPPHRWLIVAIVWEILLVFVLIQIPALRESFGILIPTSKDLAVILGFGAFIFLAMELLKMVFRKKLGRSS
jgi:Ca2+-transporting ATPase